MGKRKGCNYTSAMFADDLTFNVSYYPDQEEKAREVAQEFLDNVTAWCKRMQAEVSIGFTIMK